MARSTNTPALSRRSTLAGLAALSASSTVAGAAMLIPMTAVQPDAELLAACEAWHIGQALTRASFEEFCRLEDASEDSFSERPKELRQPMAVPVPGFTALVPEGPGWTVAQLQSKIDSATIFRCEAIDVGETQRVLTMETLPVPAVVLAHLQELLVIAKDYERQEQETKGPVVAAEHLAEEYSDRQRERLLDICDMPARTLAGLLAKAKVLQADDLVFTAITLSREEPSIEEWAAASILADIEALSTAEMHHG